MAVSCFQGEKSSGNVTVQDRRGTAAHERRKAADPSRSLRIRGQGEAWVDHNPIRASDIEIH